MPTIVNISVTVRTHLKKDVLQAIELLSHIYNRQDWESVNTSTDEICWVFYGSKAELKKLREELGDSL